MRKYRRFRQIRKKKSFLKSKIFWFSFLGIAMVILIFYFLFFFPHFQIKDFEISGNQKLSLKQLENILKEKTQNKVLFFTSRSIFLTDLKEIENEFLRRFPLIETITLKRRLPQKIWVHVKEREPVAIFCGQEGCFLMDKNGIIFEKTEIMDDFLVFKKEIKTRLGEEVIGSQKISLVFEIKEKLEKEFGVFSKEILIKSLEDFSVVTKEGWQIYFSFKENLFWQLTKLKVVLEMEIPPEKRESLEYIDLRFGNFAPYKYRD